MSLRARFRPGPIATVFAVGAIATLCALGAWQVRRYHWKQELLAEYRERAAAPPVALARALEDPAAYEWRRVRARGRLDRRHSVALLHVPREMRTGARVVTPLLLPEPLPDGTEAVLVDRGWVPAEQLEPLLRAEAEAEDPADRVEIVGLVLPLELGAARPGTAADFQIGLNRLRGETLQAQLPYRIAPVLLVREAGEDDSVPIGGWDPPRSRVDHVTYAITWFGMAVVAFAVWIAYGLAQARRTRGGGEQREPPAPPAP